MAYTKERAHQFCQEIAQADLDFLQSEIVLRHGVLIRDELPEDEEVFSLLYEYLALLRAKYAKLQILAAEPFEKKTLGEMMEYFNRFVREETDGLHLAANIWGFAEVRYQRAIDDSEKARWLEIRQAIHRIYKAELDKFKVLTPKSKSNTI